MKRLGNLIEPIGEFDNLYHAYRKARKGKQQRPEVADFTLNLERNLLQIQRDLLSGNYQPGEYQQFRIYERKPRVISKAPFRDRVVHHAIIGILEPIFERRFYYHSYACRKGKGVHAAVETYQQWARHYCYCIKLDVAKYFPSVDHEILKSLIARIIKDKHVLEILNRLIDSAPPVIESTPVWFAGDDLFTPLERRRGLPVGNLTSQIFANVYLNPLDHAVSQTLKLPYLRYVDDMILLANDKSSLHEAVRFVKCQLATLRLRLRARPSQVQRTAEGVEVLGYQVFPHRRRVRSDNGYRYRRRLKAMSRAYALGQVDFDPINQSIQSWLGHVRHADSRALRRAVLSEVVFQRGSVP